VTIKDFKMKARVATFAAGMSVAGMAQSLLNRPSTTPAPSKGSRPPGGVEGMPPGLRQRASADKSMRPRQLLGSLARHAMNGIDVGFHSLAALKYQKPESLESGVGEKVDAGDAGHGRGIDADKAKTRPGGNGPKPAGDSAVTHGSLEHGVDRFIAEVLDSTAASNGLTKKYGREALRPAFETAFHGLRTVRGLLARLAQEAPAKEFPKAMSTDAWVADQRSRLVDAGRIEPSSAEAESVATPSPRPGSSAGLTNDKTRVGSESGASRSSMSTTVMTPSSSGSGMSDASVNGSVRTGSSAGSRRAAPVESRGEGKVRPGEPQVGRRPDGRVRPQLPLAEMNNVLSEGIALAQRVSKARADEQEAQKRKEDLLALKPSTPDDPGWATFGTRHPQWDAEFAKAVADEQRAGEEIKLAFDAQKEHMAMMADLNAAGRQG